ncbi:hypothetical protein [Francisella hispaniensis]|uniref:Uncharacterized protein n=1 Tax=Francisella hispaniensis TaxID=622488 RepID=F4BH40_9GAMM|nr:hypothetical protein [Francisella hispaniensis]AEE26784.1 hypothetical protein FN3523_1481 [Francisella hispaniensis]
MLLTLDIKNDSTFEKLLWLLKHFDESEIEVIEQLSQKNKEEKYTDEYIQKNWKEMLMSCKSDSEYYDSDEYKADLGEYLLEKYK